MPHDYGYVQETVKIDTVDVAEFNKKTEVIHKGKKDSDAFVCCNRGIKIIRAELFVLIIQVTAKVAPGIVQIVFSNVVKLIGPKIPL